MQFLGAFTKLWIATISFIICPSVASQKIAQLHETDFHEIFYWVFLLNCIKNTELYDRPNRPQTLEDEPEEEADTDEKGPYIVQSEVEKLLRK